MKLSRILLIALQILTLMFALLSGVACTANPTSPTIYTDQLRAGWEDWSWDCDCNLRSTTETYNGQYAIAVNLSAWGGLGIGRHSAVSTAGYDQLEFFIHGGRVGKQELRVSLEDEAGHEIPTQGGIELNNPLYLEGGQITSLGTWQRVTIPLEDLGAKNTRITKINIMENLGGYQPTFYIDDISLKSSNTR